MADDHAKNLLQPNSAAFILPRFWRFRQMFATVPNTHGHVLAKRVWLQPKEQRES